MSLTSHLKQDGSPVREFMQQRFGNTAGFVRRCNTALKELDTLRPSSSDAPHQLLGTAIDYRIRYYFQDAAIAAPGRRQERRSWALGCS